MVATAESAVGIDNDLNVAGVPPEHMVWEALMVFAPVKLFRTSVKESVSVQIPFETLTDMTLVAESTSVVDAALESKVLPDTPVVCGELLTKN